MVIINRKIDVKDKIVKILADHPEGLTIQYLADDIGVSRQTVRAYVLELKGSGVVLRRRVGSATLHYSASLMKKFGKNFDKGFES
ncbi:MAG: helix-turn-helix domain-containing protein [Candidatus Syntrophoarchaeum sp.]|nr:helix-turn-helix domain-containing protein [Candidatus Syntrophoarchaeum sp.]